MKNIRAAASTLRLLRLVVANLVGYPPVMRSLLTRRLLG